MGEHNTTVPQGLQLQSCALISIMRSIHAAALLVALLAGGAVTSARHLTSRSLLQDNTTDAGTDTGSAVDGPKPVLKNLRCDLSQDPLGDSCASNDTARVFSEDLPSGVSKSCGALL
jgi:hypothetical protein